MELSFQSVENYCESRGFEKSREEKSEVFSSRAGRLRVSPSVFKSLDSQRLSTDEDMLTESVNNLE